MIKKISIGLLSLFSLLQTNSWGQAVSYSGGIYSQNFQSITATNLTPAGISSTSMTEVSSQSGGGSVSGWYVYGQSGTTRWGRSNGTSNTGSFFGMFDAQSTPQRAIGSQGSGSFVGYYGIVLQNTSGSTINTVIVTYDAVINRNPASATNPYPMSYRKSATNVVTSSSSGDGTFNDGAGSWTNGTGFTTPSSGTGAPGTQAAISPLFLIGGASITQTLTGLSWANNEYLYIRWKETDDSGADATAGVDNFSITTVSAPVTSTVTLTAQDPNTPTSVNWALGSIDNQFYWSSISPIGANATLSSVSANMGGNYISSDIQSNGFKLYYSTDFNFIPGGDVLLAQQSSSSGNGETITWSSLTQTIAQNATGYIYATADISGSANVGNTLTGSFTSTANVVFSPTVSYDASSSFGATTNKVFAMLPTNPTVFNTNCASEAKININLNNPTVGTVLVFANTSGSFTTPIGPGASFTGANNIYSSAANYPAVGGNLVYAGAGANFSLTGTAANTNYYFKAYSYNGSDWSSGTAVITGSTTTQPITSTIVTASSGQLQLQWTNPTSTSCYNNVIVIARQGSAVEGTVSKSNLDPSFDDTNFTGANAVWTATSSTNDVNALTSLGTSNTNFLVYKGTGNSVTLTGLTNGTPYYFRIFTVDGTATNAKWSAAVDGTGTPDVPGYYWNGGNTAVSPADGGSGIWSASNAWRQPSSAGSSANWTDGNTAIFSGTPGIITLDATRTAPSFVFNTSNYTVQTTSSTGFNLSGPITVTNNGVLVLAPNFPSTTFGTMGVGNITSLGSASIQIIGNPASSLENSRINLALASTTINLTTEIKSTSGSGMAGYVGNNVGGVVNGNLINNSNLRTMIGCTSGNDLTINGVISGSSGLQFSAGSAGGIGSILLNSTSTYGGNTIFNLGNSGIVSLGINNGLPPLTNITMAFSTSNGGIFNLNGFNQTIGNLANGTGGGSITNNSSISNSTLTITQTTIGSFNRPITDGSGGMKLALSKNGSSNLTLNGTGYSFSGGLYLNSGTLIFNPSATPVALSSCPTLFNGGTLGTSGITASSVLNYSTMNVADNSTISLGTANSHTLNFAISNTLSWTPSRTLIIVGWQGNYTTTAGSPGTVGRIFVGSNTSALSASQLDQIKFYDGSSYYDANLLSNGELVPGSSDLTQLSAGFCNYTAQNNLEFIWADSLGTPTTQTNWRYKFRLVNGTTTLTWTTTNQWPIMQFNLVLGYTPSTTYTTSVAWSNDNGASFSAYGPTCSLTSPNNLTQLSPSSCGSSPATYTTIIFADPVGSVIQYRYRLINSSLSYTQTYSQTNANFALWQFSGLQNNTTYSVDVAVNMGSGFGPYGTVCNVTTPGAPTTQLTSGSCGSSPASFATIISANSINGAQQYRYRLINSSLSYTQTYTQTNANFALWQFSGLQNNTTYSVDVAVNMGSGFGPYGTVCNVTTPGAPTTQLTSGSCGSSPASFATIIFANSINGSQQYRYRLINSSLSYTQTYTQTNANFALWQFSGLQNNTTYSVDVAVNMGSGFGPYGTVCNVTTPGAPTTQLTSGSCGSSPASFATIIFANSINGSQQYRYRLINSSLSYTQTYTQTNANFALWQFSGLQNNTTYSVDVAVNMGSGFGPYGTVCNVTTPGAPTTQLTSGSCGSSPASFSTIISANSINGASQYEYLITNTNLSYSQSYAKTQANFILSQFPGLQTNTTYSVQVRVFFNNTWGPYGSMCNVTTPSTFMRAANAEETPIIETALNVTHLEANSYPNPFTQSASVRIKTDKESDQIIIKVFDITGRFLELHSMNPKDTSDITIGKDYPAGIYYVVINQSNYLKTLKIIKN